MSWVAIDGQELALIERRVRCPATRSHFQGYVHQPGYYRRGALVRMETIDKKRTYIAAGGGALSERLFIVLDGTSEAIKRGNRAAQIDIQTAADADAYLRFFCAFLHFGAGSTFNILDALQPGWVTDAREEIDVVPMKIWDAGRPGHFHAQAFIEFAGELVVADFAIRHDSLVAMLEDEPLGRLGPSRNQLSHHRLHTCLGREGPYRRRHTTIRRRIVPQRFVIEGDRKLGIT